MNPTDKNPNICNQSTPMAAVSQEQNALDAEINRASSHIVKLQKLAQLREAARPLMEFLRRNHHPHTCASVSTEKVVIAEVLVSVNFDE